MTRLVAVEDLHYNQCYRFHMTAPVGAVYERSYHGKEEIKTKGFLKVRKLNGNIAPSLSIEDIGSIEPLVLKAVKQKKRR